MRRRSTARARTQQTGRGFGSPGGPIETKTTRLRERVVDRLRSQAFREKFRCIVTRLWDAEIKRKPLPPLWLLTALEGLPNYHLIPQNVREEVLYDTLMSLRWHVGAVKCVGPDGNARDLPAYRNHDAESRAIEEARSRANGKHAALSEDELRRIGDAAGLQPHLTLRDAFADGVVEHLEGIARRYERKQPVRELIDQDVGEFDVLIQITVPARGFQRAINDARAEALARLDRERQEETPRFPYTRWQRTRGTQEPNELVALLGHELRCYATEPESHTLLWAWLSEKKKGPNRELARLLIARKGWPTGRLKTVEKELCRIRFEWQARDEKTGAILWPDALEYVCGPMRGDRAP